MTELPSRLTTALADRYRLERKLGEGGMATVYLAADLKHERKVAIKVLKPELAAVLGAERFLAEIRTTANLQHPHILPLFDSGEAGGLLWYAMPYVEGETLRGRLDREKQLPVDEAVALVRKVAGALQAAHDRGIVHRDMKPENILLGERGEPLVSDFGIALAVQEAGGGRLTETGLSLGTPYYMSPEQATGDRLPDARSDVYALGCVLYEALTGEPPFTGNTAQAVLGRILTADPTRPTELRRSVPGHVEAAVLTALEKTPADRFGSAEAFAAALGDAAYRRAAEGASSWAGRSAGARPRSWWSDPRSLALAAFSVASLAWAALDRPVAVGPTLYDVALPDSAPLAITGQQSFSVANAGDFVVYQAGGPGGTALWYRSLRDQTASRIPGTEDGQRPTISPDGSRVAFVRFGDQARWTLEVVPVAGGAAATLGDGVGDVNLQWLDDGRIQVMEGDGNHARWFDPEGATSASRRTAYCVLPTLIPDRDELLCGGGGSLWAWRVPLGDSLSDQDLLWSGTSDSSRVFGSDFRVVDGKYLVYVSVGGDLQAAPVDLGTGRVGRGVRLLTGIGRSDYFGAGIYALSPGGTLVYAQGANHAVGNLVATDGGTIDTLNVGREAFRLFAVSPDGRRLASLVDGLQGQELRVYDLGSGEHVVVATGVGLHQPIWSPGGDRLLFVTNDSIWVIEPDRSEPPRLAAVAPGLFEAFTWGSEDRIIGTLWASYLAVSLDLTRTPAAWDTLATSASFATGSPDGRWIAYNDPDLTAVWVSPLPANGQRYQVATGSVAEPQWRSAGEIVYGAVDSTTSVARFGMEVSRGAPVFTRLPSVSMPGYVETAGQSYQLMPDGRILYVSTARDEPKRFLRVVPDWVAQMKRAVDEANR